MPQNRTFDVFLLEDGTELELVTQNFVRLQPTITMTSDVVVTLSMAILKIADNTCKDISAKTLSKCIIAKMEESLPPQGINCLPFPFHGLFSGWQKEYPLCTDESEAAGLVYMVNFNYIFTMF